MKNLLLLNYFLEKFKDLLLDVCVAQMPFQFCPLQFGLLNNLAIYLFIYLFILISLLRSENKRNLRMIAPHFLKRPSRPRKKWRERLKPYKHV